MISLPRVPRRFFGSSGGLALTGRLAPWEWQGSCRQIASFAAVCEGVREGEAQANRKGIAWQFGREARARHGGHRVRTALPEEWRIEPHARMGFMFVSLPCCPTASSSTLVAWRRLGWPLVWGPLLWRRCSVSLS